HALAALRVAGKQLAQVQVADLLVVVLQRAPRGQRPPGHGLPRAHGRTCTLVLRRSARRPCASVLTVIECLRKMETRVRTLIPGHDNGSGGAGAQARNRPPTSSVQHPYSSSL